MAINYTNIFHSKSFQNLPKLEFLVWKIYHLAIMLYGSHFLRDHRNSYKISIQIPEANNGTDSTNPCTYKCI
jgi:hypothetical protein